jgi:hypothetical protein
MRELAESDDAAPVRLNVLAAIVRPDVAGADRLRRRG